MARITAQDCFARIPNHFALCILAARRARDLAAGRQATVQCDNKVAVTSLREIAAGHVQFQEDLDDAITTHIAELKSLDGGRARDRSARPGASGASRK